MVGTYIISGIGDFWAIEREHEKLLNSGPDRVSPFFIVSAIVNLASGNVSIRHGAKGPNSATATAFSAGARSSGISFRVAFSPGVDPCPELEERAGIWEFSATETGQVAADGQRYATGVRNANALDIDPATGAPYAAIHGRDQPFENWPDPFAQARRRFQHHRVFGHCRYEGSDLPRIERVAHIHRAHPGVEVREEHDTVVKDRCHALVGGVGAEAAALENQADALREEGERKEQAIDAADVNASATTSGQVNAM